MLNDMGSNLLSEFDQLAFIEARMTVDEVCDVLGITLQDILEDAPEGSVELLMEYLEDE